MNTKGKNGSGLHQAMGLEPLRKINEPLPLVMCYPHKIVNCKRKKVAKKENVIVIVL
jgi:hypothetical protein